MANTVSILNYNNTFGDWMAKTNSLILENNDIAANNYTKPTGTLYLNDPTLGLQVYSNSIFGGTLFVQGTGSSVYIQNNLRTDQQVYFQNTTLGLTNAGVGIFNGQLRANGSAYGLYVANNAYIKGDLLVGNDLRVNGSGFFGETLTVQGNTSLYKNLYVAENTSIGGNTTIDGTIRVTGAGLFGNTVTIIGNTFLANNLSVGGNITANGSGFFGQNLTVQGNTFLANNLVVGGNIVANGSGFFGQNLTVQGNTFLANNLLVGGNITANGSGFFGQNLQVVGNTLVGNNLVVGGSTRIGGDINVYGNTYLSNVISISGGQLTVTGNTFLANNLSVGGNITANGSGFFGQNLTVSGNTILGNYFVGTNITGVTASINTLTGTSITATNITGTNGFFTTLTVSGNFYISGPAIYSTSSFTLNGNTAVLQPSASIINYRYGQSANATIRWTESNKYWDILDVDDSNPSTQWSRIMTANMISTSLTSTSTSTVASSSAANTLNDKINTANTFLQANDLITLNASKSYTDTANTSLRANDLITLNASKSYTDTTVSTSNTSLRANDLITLNASKSYTDTSNTFLQANDLITLNASKSYTDTANTSLRANDLITLNASKSYTDTANTFLQANDAVTLSTAKSYTDTFASNATNLSTGTLPSARLPDIVTAANFGGASTIPTFQIDAKGRITSASNVTASIANTQITGKLINSQLANSSITITAGTGMSGGGSVSLGGSITLTNAGVTSLSGTANQVSVSSSNGSVTLSLPQSIATSSGPTFSRLFFGDGSATAPSMTFSSEASSNTGFYWGGSGFINIATNGQYRGQFKNDGTFYMTNSISSGVDLVAAGWVYSGGEVRGSIFRDINDANYYCDPTGTSYLSTVDAAELKTRDNLYLGYQGDWISTKLSTGYLVQSTDLWNISSEGWRRTLYQYAGPTLIEGGTTAQWYIQFRSQDGDATRSILTGTGDFYTNGNITAYWSDRRLKKNINKISDWREIINGINGYRFEWNDIGIRMLDGGEDPGVEVGLIAQEIQSVLPQAATIQMLQYKDKVDGVLIPKEDINYDPENPYLTVREEKLIPVLVEAIKGLMQEIDDLKTLINGLEG